MCQEDWNSIQDKGNSRGKFTGSRNFATSRAGDVGEIGNEDNKCEMGPHRARYRIIHFYKNAERKALMKFILSRIAAPIQRLQSKQKPIMSYLKKKKLVIINSQLYQNS